MRTQKKTGIKGRAAVLVRTYYAGVHFGYLESREGREVTLVNSRRAFRFQIDHVTHGTNQVSCSELAKFGPARDSRIAVRVSRIVLLDAIEVLFCEPDAIKAFEAWPS